MRRAKIAGAIAWYLECPVCGSDAISNDTGSYDHGYHTTSDDSSETLDCDDCGAELLQAKIPKKIAIY